MKSNFKPFVKLGYVGQSDKPNPKSGTGISLIEPQTAPNFKAWISTTIFERRRWVIKKRLSSPCPCCNSTYFRIGIGTSNQEGCSNLKRKLGMILIRSPTTPMMTLWFCTSIKHRSNHYRLTFKLINPLLATSQHHYHHHDVCDHLG